MSVFPTKQCRLRSLGINPLFQFFIQVAILLPRFLFFSLLPLSFPEWRQVPGSEVYRGVDHHKLALVDCAFVSTTVSQKTLGESQRLLLRWCIHRRLKISVSLLSHFSSQTCCTKYSHRITTSAVGRKWMLWSLFLCAYPPVGPCPRPCMFFLMRMSCFNLTISSSYKHKQMWRQRSTGCFTTSLRLAPLIEPTRCAR